MNTLLAFLLLTVVLTLIAIALYIRHSELWSVFVVIGGALSAILFVASLIGSWRTTTEQTTSFEVIPARYRLIVNAFGREHQFTDARTVALADRIVKVQLVSQFNAWGVLLEQGNQAPRLELVLKEAP